MVIISGSMPLITEFESVPETEIQALSLTRPSLMMPLVIASSPHSTLICSRATYHFTRAHWATGSSMGSTFNDYSRVIQATGDVDASYHIGGISLEYDMVTLPELARIIDTQYKGRLVILYDWVLRHRKMTMDKSNTLWNINLNVPARSMKGILMLFENVAAQQPFACNTEAFHNPQITTVEITIEGIPNQLYSQGMRAYQIWDEAKKYFAASPGSKHHPEVGTAAKDLAMAVVNLGEFLSSKYSLWLDLRTSDDDRLHGSGRRIENAREGITIQITKKAEAAGVLNIYLFVVMDAKLNIEDGRFVSAAYQPLAADGPFGGDMRTDRMWKNSFHLGSARRPLPGVLSIHRGLVPDRTA